MGDVPLRDLVLAQDMCAADWITRGVHACPIDAGRLMPDSFEAYGRLFHPAYRSRRSTGTPGAEEETEDVRWTEVAAAHGQVPHSQMIWEDIVATPASIDGVWEWPPTEDRLPTPQASRLASVLGSYTSTPDCCWFAVWHGFGTFPLDLEGVPLIELPDREMVLLTGPLSAAASNFAAEPWEQSANLWWPDDHAWCIATELDFKSTYIGGPDSLINALLGDEMREVLQVEATDDLTG
jgi:hypothetical protein